MSATVDPQAIKQLPLSVLRTLPAGVPPPGVQPNFENPPSLVPVVLSVGTSFLVLAFCCFSIRAWTKLTIVKKFSWDDCESPFVDFISYHEAMLTITHQWRAPSDLLVLLLGE